MIVFAYAMSGLGALSFTQATTEMTLLAAAMFFSFFQGIGSLAMTVYTPEVYPVQIRGKGAALAMGWGRFGGVISPLVAGVLIGANSIVYVWCIMAAFLFTASGLTLAMAYETRGNLELVSREA